MKPGRGRLTRLQVLPLETKSCIPPLAKSYQNGARRQMRTAFLFLASCHLAHCLHIAPPAARRRAPAPRCLATGDRVKVISDVASKGVATLGMRGIVLDMWEQDAENWGSCCELDPACAASVTVRLDPPLGYYEVSEVQRIDGSRTGDLVEGEEVRVCRDVGAKGIPNTNGMTGAASL